MEYLKKALQIIGVVALLFSLIYAATNSVSIASLENNGFTKETALSTKPMVEASLPIPTNINFSGEPVPIGDTEVLERLDRELLVNTYWQSNAVLLMKRSKKYFPIMAPILDTYGVPRDFLYLAVAESGLEPVRSPAGAAGFWQLMKGTARDYKLEVNSNVDERYHIEKATVVACKYILKAKEKFGSWTLAAAAYNAGNRGISRQLERQQVNNYYDLLLGQETGRYVFRILALKTIMSSPESYGFKISNKAYYQHQPTENILVQHPIKNLSNFSKAHGITYKTLKQYNPWLRQPYLNNRSKRKYEIQFPIEAQESTAP